MITLNIIYKEKIVIQEVVEIQARIQARIEAAKPKDTFDKNKFVDNTTEKVVALVGDVITPAPNPNKQVSADEFASIMD